jgi:hypothetical protein
VRKNKDAPPSGIRKRKGGRVSLAVLFDRRSSFRAPEDVWSYKSASGPLVGGDLTGYKVEAIDGDIGMVNNFDEVGDAYPVVDTGKSGSSARRFFSRRAP